MKPDVSLLRPWIRDLRPRSIECDGVMVFRPMLLYLSLMCFLDDTDDRPETEHEVLAHIGDQLQLRELVSIHWWDDQYGPSETSIIIAHTPEDGMLVLQVADEMLTIALGPERDLQAIAAFHPSLVFPHLAARGAVLREVLVRYDVCWTHEDLASIVEALVGVRPVAEHLRRRDLLTRVDPE